MWNFLCMITLLSPLFTACLRKKPLDDLSPPIGTFHATFGLNSLKFNSTVVLYRNVQDDQCFMVANFGGLDPLKRMLNLTIVKQSGEIKAFHAGKCYKANEGKATKHRELCLLSISFKDPFTIQIGYTVNIKFENEILVKDIHYVNIESSHELQIMAEEHNGYTKPKHMDHVTEIVDSDYNESAVRLTVETPKCSMDNTQANNWQQKFIQDNHTFFLLQYEDAEVRVDVNAELKVVFPFKHRAIVKKVIIRNGWRLDLGHIRVISSNIEL